MTTTLSAFKTLIANRFLSVLAQIAFWVALVASTYFVRSISKDLQDAFLTILSILFPLIAGFLTFGRELMKKLTVKIDEIKDKENKRIGRPVTSIDKRRIQRLKDLSKRFTSIILSTFVMSLILLVGLLVAKFNGYHFITNFAILDENHIVQLVPHVLLKFLFFYCVFIMLLNSIYLCAFIVRVTKDDDLID